jgi:hypothetical protein
MDPWVEAASKIHLKAFEEEINVLVFGPGKPTDENDTEKMKIWNKRIKIKDHLNEKFPNSQKKGLIIMPEDKIKKTKLSTQTNLEAERDLARASHLIIVLDCGTRGVATEIDTLSEYPWFRERTYIFLKKDHVKTKGLVKDIYSKYPQTHVKGYTQEEFDSCQLVTKKILRQAQVVALNRMYNHEGYNLV